jgi:hypothetical protein
MKNSHFWKKYHGCKTRSKMCQTCAFRDESAEALSGMLKNDLMPKLIDSAAPFLCHETMQQIPNKFKRLKKLFAGKNSKWISNFNPLKNRKGEDVAINQHHICAGYAKFFEDRFEKGFSRKIPTENHYYKKVLEEREDA